MRLLQKTIQSYFIYSVIVLLVAAPVFYFVIQGIVIEDVDEDLLLTKEMLKPKISEALTNNTIGELKFLDHDIKISISHYTTVKDSFRNYKIYDHIADELVPHRVLISHFTLNGQPCRLEINTSLVDQDELIESIVMVQFFLLLFLLAGLLAINKRLSIRIWKPFYSSIEKIHDFKIDNEQHPLVLEKSSIDEFNDLNRSLTDLTHRANSSYQLQKEFTENASHEMQTPLAVLQSKVELLMQTNPITEEQAQLIEEIEDASQRMSRLNKSLILLTKIENHQFFENELVYIDQIVRDFIQQYQPQIVQKNINIRTTGLHELPVRANKALIEIMMGNLIGNAIRHNIVNGFISLRVNNRTVTIENTGSPLPIDEKRIFQRFHKEASELNGIGLGLEIVNQIAKLNGYVIGYEPANGNHKFLVDFGSHLSA